MSGNCFFTVTHWGSLFGFSEGHSIGFSNLAELTLVECSDIYRCKTFLSEPVYY